MGNMGTAEWNCSSSNPVLRCSQMCQRRNGESCNVHLKEQQDLEVGPEPRRSYSPNSEPPQEARENTTARCTSGREAGKKGETPSVLPTATGWHLRDIGWLPKQPRLVTQLERRSPGSRCKWQRNLQNKATLQDCFIMCVKTHAEVTPPIQSGNSVTVQALT